MKIAASVLFISTFAITFCPPAHAQQATIAACKPGTGVRVYKHFLSIRASGRIACGSTVEVVNHSPSWALVQQGTVRGYVQPWHLNFGGSQASTAPQSGVGAFLSAIAQGLQAYGSAAMTPSEQLARTCLATPGCTLEVQTDQQWTPVTQPQQAATFPQTLNFRMFNGSTFYTATVVQPLGTFQGHPLPVQGSPALILYGGGLNLAIVNGYAYNLGTDGQWHPTGLGPGQQLGVDGLNP